MKTKLTSFELAIQELVKNQVKTLVGLDSFKRKIAKKFNISTPSNVKLLKAYHDLVKNKRLKTDKNLEFLLRKRRVRSLSGIVNVSILTKSYPCPGKCIYCPEQKGIPKSYLKGEPAVQRAILTNFDPYLQIQTRLKSLEATGHPTDKIELRIIGGTWSYYPKKYQTWFIEKCFEACNQSGFPKKDEKREPFPRKMDDRPFYEEKLKAEQRRNERAKQRIIGITIETRPDFINKEELKRMRELGVTRVELGVQSIYDDVLKLNERGHKIEATIKATKLLKDAGFKLSYQMMPNLPGSDYKRDAKMFEKIFSNPDFQPDLLKIYPSALVKEAPLYGWYKKGKFKPYSKKKLIKLLIKIKKQIPYYCRIQRIIRDIPSENIIEGGVKTSNLREIVQKEMKKQGLKCKCIRCREVRENYDPKEKPYFFRQDYDASGGKEIFLSYENKNRTRLYSLLRLRIPAQVLFHKTWAGKPPRKHFLPVLQDAAIIREIHTYGQLVPVAKKQKAPQHKGLGKKLMKEAEKIAKKEFGICPVKSARGGAPKGQFNRVNKIAVISGIGTRNYFRKLGYRLKDTYMVKKI